MNVTAKTLVLRFKDDAPILILRGHRGGASIDISLARAFGRIDGLQFIARVRRHLPIGKIIRKGQAIEREALDISERIGSGLGGINRGGTSNQGGKKNPQGNIPYLWFGFFLYDTGKALRQSCRRVLRAADFRLRGNLKRVIFPARSFV